MNKENRKQDSSKENKISIHALATTSSSLDDNDFRGYSKGLKWKEQSEKDAKVYSFETTSLRKTDEGN